MNTLRCSDMLARQIGLDQEWHDMPAEALFTSSWISDIRSWFLKFQILHYQILISLLILVDYCLADDEFMFVHIFILLLLLVYWCLDGTSYWRLLSISTYDLSRRILKSSSSHTVRGCLLIGNILKCKFPCFGNLHVSVVPLWHGFPRANFLNHCNSEGLLFNIWQSINLKSALRFGHCYSSPTIWNLQQRYISFLPACDMLFEGRSLSLLLLRVCGFLVSVWDQLIILAFRKFSFWLWAMFMYHYREHS